MTKRNSMNKWMTGLTAFIAALALSFATAPANGQQKQNPNRQDTPIVQVDPGKVQMAAKVALKCAPYNHSDVSAIITITNNSGQAIPQGTSISWQLKGKKGTAPVSAGGLQPNKSFDVNTGLDWKDNGPCSAYFMKK